MLNRFLRSDPGILVILTLASGLAVLTSPPGVLRFPFGFLLLLFLPGYALMAALFPAGAGLRRAEILSLSVGLSVVASVLLGLLAAETSWGLHRSSVVACLGGLVLVCAGIAWFRARSRASSVGAADGVWGSSEGLKPYRRLAPGAALLAVLVLAYFMTFIPHMEYRLPLHVDEWWHYGNSQSLIEAQTADYPNPFDSGESFVDAEVGFHVFLGELRLLTGMAWIDMFRFLPGVILCLVAFAAYAVSDRRSVGLAAALLVALIPTGLRFLGPAFLVPVALGLAFVPVVVLVLRRTMADGRGPLLLFLMVLTLLFVHPPTMAFVMGTALAHMAFLASGARDGDARLRPLAVGLGAMAVVCLLMALWIPSALDLVLERATDSEAQSALPLGSLWDPLADYGYVAPFLGIAGLALLIMRGERREWALAASLVGMLAFLWLYRRFHIGPDIMYERGWLYTYVLMALAGGPALVGLAERLSMVLRRTRVHLYAMPAAALLLVALAFGPALRSHIGEHYYHVVEEDTYQDFVWVGENVAAEFNLAVLHTSEAWAFAPVTGKYVYAAEAWPETNAKGRAAMEFLIDGAKDTEWLRRNGIRIVYAEGRVENDSLTPVHRNTYLLIEGAGGRKTE